MQVSEVQRARILMAIVRVVAERGVGSATVARIISRAGVSRRTFYELFSGCEDCFLAVFQDTVERASKIATEAVAATGSSGWRDQVRAGLAGLLVFFDDEPTLGSLLVVDALGAGPRVLERRARVLEMLTAIVDQGRSQAKSGRGVALSSSSPSLTAEGVVGAVLSVIHARMVEQSTAARFVVNGSSSRSRHDAAPGPLLGLLNPLMGMIVLPYLGRAVAAKELARPTPKCPRGRTSGDTAATRTRRGETATRDPLQGLNMRLTYRTLKVLSVIAADPGASNRQIADAAGIHDQGQISKLLGRLEKLGLIHNSGNGQPRGEPNAWTLTTKGGQVEQTVRIQTSGGNTPGSSMTGGP